MSGAQTPSASPLRSISWLECELPGESCGTPFPDEVEALPVDAGSVVDKDDEGRIPGN